MIDFYELAVRTWLAEKITDGDRKRIHADDIRNLRFVTDYGFGGSEVTPPDEPWVAVAYELRQRTGFPSPNEWRWRQFTTPVPTNPVALVHEVLAVYHRLLAEGPP